MKPKASKASGPSRDGGGRVEGLLFVVVGGCFDGLSVLAVSEPAVDLHVCARRAERQPVWHTGRTPGSTLLDASDQEGKRMTPEATVTLSARPRSVFGLLAALLSIHRPMVLRHWTPEDVLTEVAHDIEAIRQRLA